MHACATDPPCGCQAQIMQALQPRCVTIHQNVAASHLPLCSVMHPVYVPCITHNPNWSYHTVYSKRDLFCCCCRWWSRRCWKGRADPGKTLGGKLSPRKCGSGRNSMGGSSVSRCAALAPLATGVASVSHWTLSSQVQLLRSWLFAHAHIWTCSSSHQLPQGGAKAMTTSHAY